MINVRIDSTIVGGHGNLLLSLEPIGFLQVADTYYFALDTGFKKDDESEEKVIQNLRNLLTYWIAAVERLEADDVRYLPFDFSDQYIGCLRVVMHDGQDLLIDYGYTRKFEGSSFMPSRGVAFILDDSDYDQTTDAFLCKKSVMLLDIRRSIDINFARASDDLLAGDG